MNGIAAICLQYGFPVATFDHHFSNVPNLQIQHPWIRIRPAIPLPPIWSTCDLRDGRCGRGRISKAMTVDCRKAAEVFGQAQRKAAGILEGR